MASHPWDSTLTLLRCSCQTGCPQACFLPVTTKMLSLKSSTLFRPSSRHRTTTCGQTKRSRFLSSEARLSSSSSDPP
jgi:hypothetical protein